MSKLDDLIAKIKLDVAIKRRADGSTTVIGPAQRRAQEKREQASDPALTALMRASNASAKNMNHAPVDPYRTFHEIAHCTLLQKQVCRCCGEAQVHVAAEMLHLRGIPTGLELDPRVRPVDVWIRRSTFAQLPHEEPLWAPTQSVAYCAECTQQRHSTQVDLRGPEVDGQLSLIH